MKIKWSTISILTLSYLVFANAQPSHAGLVIGGWDSSRNSGAGINGPYLTQLTTDISAKFPTATITSTSTLTASYLSTVNILVIGDGVADTTATTALSGAEQTALYNFVLGGGSAIITVDNDTFQSGVSAINNSYISPFGLHVTGTINGYQLATATTSTGPIMNGPFGPVSTLQSAWPGYFDSLGSYATSLATLNTNSQPLIAEIAPGVLGSGSGGVLIASDSILNNGVFDQHDNAILFNNAVIDFSQATVPEPSSIVLLVIGGLVMTIHMSTFQTLRKYLCFTIDMSSHERVESRRFPAHFGQRANDSPFLNPSSDAHKPAVPAGRLA